MQIMDMINAAGGMQSIAGELGVSETQARSGAEALLPAILGGFKKQAQSHPAGLDGVMNNVSGLGGGALMDEVLAPQPTDVGRGNNVLAQIFGSKDVSRTVAQNASSQTGLDPAVLKKMLPMLSMLVAGMMAKHGNQASGSPMGGGLGALVGGLMGGGHTGGHAGAGGLASMLDLNGDGNPLDDIMGMLGR